MQAELAVIGCGPLGRVVAAAGSAAGLGVSLYCTGHSRVEGELIRISHGGGETIARVRSVARLDSRVEEEIAVVALHAAQLGGVVERLQSKTVFFTQPSPVVAGFAGKNAGLLAFYGCAWGERTRPVTAFEASSVRVAAPSSSDTLSRLVEGFKVLGVEARTYGADRLDSLLWDYVAAHASVQPVATLLGTTFGRLRRSRHARGLIESLAREVMLVMEEKGVRKLRSPVDAAYELLNIRGCRPKMLRDVEEKGYTEVDYINGYIVREALRAGLYAPYNDAMYLQVKALEEIMAE